MDVLIGFESALEFWRGCRNEGAPYSDARSIYEAARRDKKRLRSASIPSARYLASIKYPKHIKTTPMTLLYSDTKERFEARNIVARKWNAPTMNTFVRVNEVFYVSNPEACLAQMARRVDLVELIALGFEFCGTYSMLNNRAEYGIKPITTNAALMKMAQTLPKTSGVQAFRRAVKYILEDSASPAETQLAMLLTLHPLLGGYGLPAPEMNRYIEIPESLRPMLGYSKLRCDLLWRGKHGPVGVEYKSDEFHLDKKNFTTDSKRNNALKEIGVTVIEVTTRQLYNSKEFDRIAQQIARAIGYRFQSKVENQMSRRFELRKKVLFQLYPTAAANNAATTSAANAAAVNDTNAVDVQRPTSASGSRDWLGERSKAPRSGGSYSGR